MMSGLGTTGQANTSMKATVGRHCCDVFGDAWMSMRIADWTRGKGIHELQWKRIGGG